MQLIKLLLLAALVLLYGREQYKRGVEDVKFDRVIADIKLKNCSEVITKFKL
jgi:hypothetical protein